MELPIVVNISSFSYLFLSFLTFLSVIWGISYTIKFSRF